MLTMVSKINSATAEFYDNVFHYTISFMMWPCFQELNEHIRT